MASKQGIGNSDKRVEKDSIGQVEVPAGSYYGSFTSRAKANFDFGGIENACVKKLAGAYVKIKLASCRANASCGLLDAKRAQAIEKACLEALEGKFDSQFVLGFYQAGAGTPFNMNANEVIANRANELLGAQLGSYKFVHPNNEVNMGQSSNDVTPSAIRLALLESLPQLEAAIKNLCETFGKKAAKYRGKIKVGRTHLQDAVPVGIDQEILSWQVALAKDLQSLQAAKAGLLEIGLGGTALGTGIACHPDFSAAVAKELSKITGDKITSGANKQELTGNMNAFLAVSAAMRATATTCVRISNDFKLLVSGPNAGFAEITIPEAEPGSSIMPGKVNPSIPEALEIISLDAIASDHAVALACAAGQLQLNVLTPLIAKNTLMPCTSLSRGIDMFDRLCCQGMEYDMGACQKHVDSSYIFATALNPYLGYSAVAALVKESLKSKAPVAALVLKYNLMDKASLEKILDPTRLTGPSPIDLNLAQKTKSAKAHIDFLKKMGKA